ncbi:hypothetical protein Plhal304r1_c019g0066961 [Plasmopara halstedii]
MMTARAIHFVVEHINDQEKRVETNILILEVRSNVPVKKSTCTFDHSVLGTTLLDLRRFLRGVRRKNLFKMTLSSDNFARNFILKVIFTASCFGVCFGSVAQTLSILESAFWKDVRIANQEKEGDLYEYQEFQTLVLSHG